MGEPTSLLILDDIATSKHGSDTSQMPQHRELLLPSRFAQRVELRGRIGEKGCRPVELYYAPFL